MFNAERLASTLRATVILLAVVLLGVITIGFIGDSTMNAFTIPEQIVSVELVAGRLEVVRVVRPGVMIATNPPQEQVYVYKDVYEARGDSIVLANTVLGTYVPPSRNPERYLFGDEGTR